MAAAPRINMNFKGVDIRDVLRTIAELSDINLVTDGSVTGNITIHLKDITFLDALKLITQTGDLAYKWYENTVVVATTERMDQLYSNITVKTIFIEYAELTKVKDIANQVYPDLGITIDNRNHNLILKGKDEDIQRTEELIAKLDTKQTDITEVIPIPAERADFLINYMRKIYPELLTELDSAGNIILYGSSNLIKEATLLIDKLVGQYDNQENEIVDNNIMGSIKVEYVEIEYIKGIINQMYPEIKIISDPKNSQLIFDGSEEEFKQINHLVSRIDIKVEEEQSQGRYIAKIFNVEHAELTDIKKAIEDVSPSISVKPITGTNQLLLQGLEKDINLAVSIASTIDQQRQRITKIANIDYSVLQDIEAIITKLYPDVGYNTNVEDKKMVIFGEKDKVGNVVALIDKIDIPRKQVIIEVRIEEVSSRDMDNLGVNPDSISKIEIIDENADGLIDGLGLSIPQFINAMKTKGISNTLANPRLMTLSGEEARLLIGDKIPITLEEFKDDKIVTSIEYIEVGIKLLFTPWVTADNKVSLKIHPQISTIGESIGTALPPINTREVETNVILNDGEPFAIGGLIQDDEIESLSKIPLLSDIPILGQLFKHRKVENFKTELIIFITPHIVNDNMNRNDTKSASDDGQDIILNTLSQTEEDVKDDQEVLDREEIDKKKEEDRNLSDQIIIGKNDSENKESEKTNSSGFVGLTKEELFEIIGFPDQEEEEKIENEESEEAFAKNDQENSNKDEEQKEEESFNDQTKTKNEIINNQDELIVTDIQSEQDENLTIADEVDKTDQIISKKEKSEHLEIEEKPEIQVKEEIQEKEEVQEKQEKEEEQEQDVQLASSIQIDRGIYYFYNYFLSAEITTKELADLFNVKEELIKEANKSIEASVGTNIKIPIVKSRIYILNKGDTIWKIHSLYDISVEEIKKINNIEDENDLPIGSVIVIP